MATLAENTPGISRCSVTKKGRMPGVPTVLAGPGGTSRSDASEPVPRIERAAVTRESTVLAVKATLTSEVGSEKGLAPPALTVRAKKVWREAPAGASAFSAG